MKAFLSHSSKDKPFVEEVASHLRPGTFELDSLTFDAGAVNSQAIIDALKRCDLFCLFLSENSVTSSYVNFETLLGMEFLARGGIRQFLVICLDEVAFTRASENAKFFNIVRRVLTAETAARLIQGNLVSASKLMNAWTHPFMGRSDDLLELERQITDTNRPPSKAIYISGNYGTGRKTLLQKFYRDHYPHVGTVFATISIKPFSGLEELYRHALIALRPSLRSREFAARAQSFAAAGVKEKRRQISDLLNSALPANEATLLLDDGGLLSDQGALEFEINEIVSGLEFKPHPPIAFVAPRMIPLKLRRPQNDISYLPLKSLGRDSSKRLMSKLLKDRGISANETQLSDLVVFSEGHPFNFYRLIEEIDEKGLAPFLANPSDFTEWKHRQSSEYLGKVQLNQNDALILGLLKLIPELDFGALCGALNIDPSLLSDSLTRLISLHIIEADREHYKIAPALRIAVERDNRTSLSTEARKNAIEFVANNLSVRIEEGSASIVLIDSAILSSIEAQIELPAIAAALLLPSHYVWLCKRHYDERRWAESIRLAREALKASDRLSINGKVTACRFMCLAATREGSSEIFDEGIKRLEALASDDWAKSNVHFLRGFNLRLKGHLPAAEEKFRAAYEFSPGNLSVAREIAAICLARGNLDGAERYAREALTHAPSNPYLLDTLISVLIRRQTNSSTTLAEINQLFDALATVGEEAGKSFYTTRRAEFEYLKGDNKKALKLIETAVTKTPSLFEPKRLQVEILLKDGNKTKALEVLKVLEIQVNARNPEERRENYRAYREVYSHYLEDIGQFDEAKRIYEDAAIFTKAEQDEAIRRIEISQAYSRNP